MNRQERLAYKRAYDKLKTGLRISKGLCWRCAEPIHPGSKRSCLIHLLYERSKYTRNDGRGGRPTVTAAEVDRLAPQILANAEVAKLERRLNKLLTDPKIVKLNRRLTDARAQLSGLEAR